MEAQSVSLCNICDVTFVIRAKSQVNVAHVVYEFFN